MGKGQHDILSRWEWLDSDAVRKLNITPSTKLVLMNLVLKWTNRNSGRAWPSMETIANYSGLSIRTVQRSIKELQGKNLIQKVGNAKSAIWRINFDLKTQADYEKEIDKLEKYWKQKGWDHLSNIPPIAEQEKMQLLIEKSESADVIH